MGDVLGGVFIVNTTNDHDDGVADALDTTLREAIHAANNHPGHDTIMFNIPGEGVKTIFAANSLPPITDEVTIDGYTQPGSHPNTLSEGDDAVLLIELKGNPQQNQTAFDIRAGNTTIRGLVVNGFNGGMIIAENGGNVIEGNFIGTDSSGSVVVSNGLLRIFAASNNLIGGTTPEARNIIAGSLTGIQISGGSGPAIIPNAAEFYAATGNLVQGNYIGTDRTGTVGLGTQGVTISGSFDNIIGGTTPGARNVIAGGGSVALGAHAVEGCLQIMSCKATTSARIALERLR